MEIFIKKARADFEQKRAPREMLIELYAKYNPTVDALLFVAEAEKIFPKLNCGLASVYLQDVLGCGEIVHGTYLGYSHTFLLLPDARIIDITADQYGGLSVYVGASASSWLLYHLQLTSPHIHLKNRL